MIGIEEVEKVKTLFDYLKMEMKVKSMRVKRSHSEDTKKRISNSMKGNSNNKRLIDYYGDVLPISEAIKKYQKSYYSIMNMVNDEMNKDVKVIK